MTADDWCGIWYFMGVATGYLIWKIFDIFVEEEKK